MFSSEVMSDIIVHFVFQLLADVEDSWVLVISLRIIIEAHRVGIVQPFACDLIFYLFFFLTWIIFIFGYVHTSQAVVSVVQQVRSMVGGHTEGNLIHLILSFVFISDIYSYTSI